MFAGSTTTRAVLAVSTIATALLLAACGGGSQAADSGTAAAPSASAAASGTGGGRPDFAAFRSCMSAHGVTMPDRGTGPSGMPSGVRPSGMPSGVRPSGGAGGGGFGFPGGLPAGVDQATFDAAQQACASLMPQGGFRGGGGIDATALAAYKSCLTDHKVTIPAGDNWMRQLDRTDAAVKAAMDTCAPLLPVPTPRPSPSATP